MERRHIRAATSKFETREENGEMTIEAYFAVFNSRYTLWDGAFEMVAPSAFDNMAGKDIKALADHDSRLVLGRTKSETLTLDVDDKGLHGIIKINPKDQEAVNLYERVKRGDVDQCSFGFEIIDQDYKEENGEAIWLLKSVELYEVSIVTFPAYEETSATARKKDFAEIKKRKLELWKNERKERLNGIKSTDAQ